MSSKDNDIDCWPCLWSGESWSKPAGNSYCLHWFIIKKRFNPFRIFRLKRPFYGKGVYASDGQGPAPKWCPKRNEIIRKIQQEIEANPVNLPRKKAKEEVRKRMQEAKIKRARSCNAPG